MVSEVYSLGYSWKTNQYGLAVDNVVAYELVLPNGRVTELVEQDEGAWFVLKVCFKSSCRGGTSSSKLIAHLYVREDSTIM
jgi:hypothetical protein